MRHEIGCEYFKPVGVPLRELEEVVLEREEVEALKLSKVDELDQKVAAESMGISQATFARIMAKANRKVAEAICEGKAIKLLKE